MDHEIQYGGGAASPPPGGSGVRPDINKNVAPPGLDHRGFLERALTAAGEWTRYSDAKALGVLFVLGLGLKDLLDHASRLVHPHEPNSAKCRILGAAGHTCAGIGASVAFVVACAFAALVVGFVTHALFSRMTLKGLLGQERDEDGIRSNFFFAEVRRYGSQEAYAQAVLATKEIDLLRDLAGQVYEVSKVCHAKHLATQRAFALALLFLAAWACARLLLAAG
jgi:hypothetical protein